VIYKQNDELHFCTRRYVRGTDFETIRDALREDLAAEERSLRAVKQSLRGLEEQMLKKLWELGRREGERL
jgi:F-type H+-transporting ATPase subunit epsilon